MIGVVSMLFSFFSLGFVIDALIATRILVQFIGQIGAVALLRRHRQDLERPYRIWLYPIPSLVAFVGWTFLFVTSEPKVIALGIGTLLLGVAIFFLWSWHGRRWPFAPEPASPAAA